MTYSLSLMIRNNVRIGDKPKDLIMHIANILFFSSLISVFISNNYLCIPFYGETNFTGQTFCFLLIAFSFTCTKSINKVIYPVLAFFSMYRIGEVNKALGTSGICYLLCAYISLILQFFSISKIEDKYKNYCNEFTDEFYSRCETPINSINNLYLNDKILKEIEERIKRNIRWEQIKALSICNQEEYKYLVLKNGKNINITIKKIDKTEYDININEAEKISKLKLELRKKIEIDRRHTIVLVWKGKVLDDNEYICSYRIKNGDIIIFLTKTKSFIE